MPPDYSLHSVVVEPSDLMSVTSSLAQSQRDLEISEIGDLVDENGTYVRGLTNIGRELGLITHEDGKYTANSDMALQFRQANREDEKQKLLKLRLQRYRPFISFIKNLLDGSDTAQAAQEVRVFYQLGGDVEDIEEQFITLAEYAGILNKNDSIKYCFDESLLSRNYFQDLGRTFQDGLVARLFLEKRLDEDIIAYMDEESFNELVNALKNFGSDPNDAVSAAARAVETFQRHLGHDYGTNNYSGPDGIRQLAQTMENDNLTKDRHQLAGEYVGEIRNNTGGHGVDPETDKHWNLSEEVAFGYILTSIHYIRSLYRWTADGHLIV